MLIVRATNVSPAYRCLRTQSTAHVKSDYGAFIGNYFSLSLISHSETLPCKGESKSGIVCWFGTEEVHRGSGKYVQRYYSLAVQTRAPAGIHPRELWNVLILRAGYIVLIEKSALQSIFRMFPFLFRAPLL